MAVFPVFKIFLPSIGLPATIVLVVDFGIAVMSKGMAVFMTKNASRINSARGHNLKITLRLPTAPAILLDQIGIDYHSFPMCNALHENA